MWMLTASHVKHVRGLLTSRRKRETATAKRVRKGVGQLVRPDRFVQQADKNSTHTYTVDLIDSEDDDIDVELKPNRHRSLPAMKTTPEYTSHDPGTCLPVSACQSQGTFFHRPPNMYK
jgi:hypothetical protein